jgi:hypothetical protein
MRGLPVWQRLQLSWKALTSQFDAGRASIARQMLGGIFPASTGPAPVRNAYQLLQTMNNSPWVRACAGRVADVRATTMWRLFVLKKNGRVAEARDIDYLQKAGPIERRLYLKAAAQAQELIEITDHVLLSALRRGSAALTGYDTRWLQSLYLDLVGECFLLKQRNVLGAPEAFWIIPPHWIAETPTPQRRSYRLQWQAFQAEVPESEILWHKVPDCVEPYQRGVGVVKSLDDEIATDEKAAKFTHLSLKNNALPPALIMPKEGHWDATEQARFGEWWQQNSSGFWRAFKPLFLKTAVEFKLIEQDYRKIQLIEMRKHERDTIMQVWGIPPEIFGVLQSSNRSTIDQAPQIFAKYCVVPRIERERAMIQERLVPEYDDRLIVDYVSPVPQDKVFRLQVMTAQPVAFQLNEYRELAEVDPLDELDGVFATGATPGQEPPPEEPPPTPPKQAQVLEALDDEELASLYVINRKLHRSSTTHDCLAV